MKQKSGVQVIPKPRISVGSHSSCLYVGSKVLDMVMHKAVDLCEPEAMMGFTVNSRPAQAYSEACLNKQTNRQTSKQADTKEKEQLYQSCKDSEPGGANL